MANLPEPFKGFTIPTYTQVPDEFFDYLMVYLSEAELRVLLYVMRRTFGFKKGSDRISKAQMEHGIKRGDGTVLDRGTGLSRRAIRLAVDGLIAAGILVKHAHQSEERGHEATEYVLNLQPGAFVPRVPRTQEAQTPRVPSTPAQSDPGVPCTPAPGYSATQAPGYSATHAVGYKVPIQETVEQERDLQEIGESNRSTYPHPVDNMMPEDSGEPARLPLYSTFISHVARDYTRLFHDGDHERPNRSRALRLWAECGFSEQRFVEVMHEARRITQSRGNIARDATDGSPAGTKNRMPYFFTVLEDLLDMASDDK